MKYLKDKKASDQALTINISRRALTTSVWLTPIITAVSLPVHAQTSEPLASLAGTYEISFENGGGITTVDCTGVNVGNTLSIGVIDAEVEITADGSIMSAQAGGVFGFDTLENAVDSSGTIDFNGTFDFDDPVLGECTTELTVTGSIVDGEISSGIILIETSCAGCEAMQESPFTGALI